MRVSKVVFLLVVVQQTVALPFSVESNGKKCLKGETPGNIVLTGEYEFSEAIGNTASVHVSFWTKLGILGVSAPVR